MSLAALAPEDVLAAASALLERAMDGAAGTLAVTFAATTLVVGSAQPDATVDRAACKADGGHQLGRALLVGAGPVPAHHTVRDVPVEQPERDLVERGLDGGDLRQDLDAVAVVVDHPLDAAHLALDLLQAGLQLVARGGVAPGHVGTHPVERYQVSIP